MVFSERIFCPLFGGALSILIPRNFKDISDIRQVPDHQEVFVNEITDSSLIIEILDMEEEITDNISKFHFDQLAQENDAADCQILQIEPMDPLEFEFLKSVPGVEIEILLGSQQVGKFNENNASNSVVVFLLVVRLANIKTDLLLTMNVPIRIDQSSSSYATAVLTTSFQNVDEFNRSSEITKQLNEFKIVAKSLQIKDWSLFN